MVKASVRKLKRSSLVLILFAVVSLTLLSRQFVEQSFGYNGVVSSENILCSRIGIQILKAGGSAVDAAISTSLCIGTTNFQSSGIGGGGFMIVRDLKETISIDFRETAPAAAFTDMYKKDPLLAQIGGLSVGVPGELRGFHEAHQKFGKLPWERLFEPIIKLADEGWIINASFAKKIKKQEAYILKDPILSRVLSRDGILLQEGDWINRPVYAKTLKALAAEGIDLFYSGWIGQSLIETIQKNGGIMTLDDLKNYKPVVELPLVGTYRGLNVYTSPPPGSGAVLLSILNILENFDIKELNPQTAHQIVEAYKFGYAQRGLLGDPIDPVYRNISQIAKFFISKEVASQNFQLIRNVTFDPLYYQPNFTSIEDGGTMHVSVLTRNGDAVSLTSTVNLVLGSRLMDDKTGIILNDEMDDFSIPGIPNAFGLAPSPYNYVHPYKRPLSSCAPTLVDKDGKIVGVVGGSGGSHITTAIATTFIRLFDLNQSTHDAVNLPRFHHQLYPNEVWTEVDTPIELIEGWKSKGHNVKIAGKGDTVSGVAAIKLMSDGLIDGAGDARKLGAAVGF